jgi:beta-mannosidase
MRQSRDLDELEWTLSGYHPYWWRWGQAIDVGPVPAKVPGSAQKALLDAGLIPDWNVGLNSRLCEWVENRDWKFETEIPAEWTAGTGQRLVRCEGLDYQGHVLVNGQEAGRFRGSLVPHSFDLTPFLTDGPNRLAIVFTEIPRYLGQIHYTSQIREWKPRFNYIWDWVPRIVQIGIWDSLRLERRDADVIESLSAYTEYDHAAGRGSIALKAELSVADARQVEVVVEGEEGEVARTTFPAKARLSRRLSRLRVQPWQPNGNGEQRLYTLRVRLLGADDDVFDEETRPVGFREIVWKPCEGAPEDAEPWICDINGVPTFLQGVNWIPPQAVFADVTEEDYRVRLQVYRDIGCNLLRVWGGAILEREAFYRLCDEMGLMVWQEFPLSSSGLDNWPPDDRQTIAEMKEIAASYITRRQHHPSLIIWCGGNELLGGPDGSKQGMTRPLDISHPMLAAQAAVVQRLDPTRRFLPTSPSGPRAGAGEQEFGQGVHHDVHGPWNMAGPLENWYKYFDGDDALFRSETGFPGASPADLIRRYGGDMALPGDSTNPFWMHTAGWWIQWPDYLREGGDPTDLDAYVAWSQERQAQALTYAARVCKARFPRCGGFMMWTGHDCYPCPVNNSIVDFLGRPKPAAIALAEVFRAAPSAARRAPTE